MLNGLFIQTSDWRLVERAYARFTGNQSPFADVAYLSKKLVMETTLSGELNVLAQMLNRISERDRRYRDFTQNSLRRALRNSSPASASIGRYLSDDDPDPADEGRIRQAIARARLRNRARVIMIFDFVLNVTVGRVGATETRAPPIRDASTADNRAGRGARD